MPGLRPLGLRVTGIRGQSSRGAGWEYVHVAIDDHSRVSFACIQPGETAHSACSVLLDTLRYFQTLGVAFTRVMTDNGSCYRSKHFAKLCRRLKLRHIRTRPYTPRTNGKAERFIQSALREWAYARAYDNSSQRGEYLPCWLHRYNWHRPHASLKYQTPIQSLNIPLNNVVGLHRLAGQRVRGAPLAQPQAERSLLARLRDGGQGQEGNCRLPALLQRGISVCAQTLPASFAMRGNYSNRFRQTTPLVFDLLWPALVTVEVMDVTGQGRAYGACGGSGRRSGDAARTMRNKTQKYRLPSRQTIQCNAYTTARVHRRLTCRRTPFPGAFVLRPH